MKIIANIGSNNDYQSNDGIAKTIEEYENDLLEKGENILERLNHLTPNGRYIHELNGLKNAIGCHIDNLKYNERYKYEPLRSLVFELLETRVSRALIILTETGGK